MKKALVILAALISFNAQADETSVNTNNSCSYVLDSEEYGTDASGDLIFNGVTYRCESQDQDESLPATVCTSEATQEPLYVSLDGAEFDFFVWTRQDSTWVDICTGTATNK
jgi:hypothetical protein